MLHDIERRALEAAHPMLIEDLEPRDALTYLKDQNISTEEHLDLISSMPTRPERIAQFLRAYRKQASALAPLIDFFVYNSQFHFSDFFEERLSIAIENPELLRSVLISPIFGTQMLERKLLLGNVPKQIDCYCRAYNVEGVIEKLSDMCNLGSFFLFLHGRAGSGKSVIASQALSILDQLIGIFYDSVVWLKDSGTKSKSTFYLFTNLLLMLKSEEDFLKFPSVEHFTSVVLKKMLASDRLRFPLRHEKNRRIENRERKRREKREQERMAEEEKKRLEKERLELEQKAQAQRRLEEERQKKKEEEKLKEELSKIKELVEQPVEQEDALRQALLKQRELRMGRAEEQLKEKMKQASSEKKTKKEKKNKKKDRRKESNRHDTSSSSPSSSSTSTDSSDSDSKTYSSDDSRRHRYRRKRRSTEHHDHRISHTHRDEKVRRRGS